MATRRPRPEVVVYTRDGCGLCRRAEELVAREARGAEVRTVDVDGDEALVRRYGVRVPVIEVDGREVAELQVEPGTVRAAVRAARRRDRSPGARQPDEPRGARRRFARFRRFRART